MSNNTKLLCFFLKAQKVDKSSEQGYAMAMVSMVSIIMFSLLSATLIFSNLSKNKTDAFVDSSSSFAIAEAGLNKRGDEFRKKLDTYAGVQPNIDSSNLDTCLGTIIPENKLESGIKPTGFGCRNYRFNSGNEVARVASKSNISLESKAKGQDDNTYIAYTLISDRTDYGLNGKSPRPTLIPTGDPFQGLNAAEYKYVLESTGKKPVPSAKITSPEYTGAELAAISRQEREQPEMPGDVDLLKSAEEKKNLAAAKTAGDIAGQSTNNISLSMTFINRVVPLFQFGIFYNGDIELNSSSKMQIKGWVHSNANIYVQPAGVEGNETNTTTDFLAKVSAAGQIYNRVDAWNKGIGRTGITRVLLTGKSGNCDTPGNCQTFPEYYISDTDPLTPSEISAFPNKIVQDQSAGAIALKTPEPGFTRKRNYFNNKVGTYYSHADMRLEMVPDRDVTAKPPSPTPWTRNQAIIPFNFTSIQTGGSGACTTAPPAANTDPAATYIDPKREDASALRCNVFTKGQLQSLRQPVLVLSKLNQSAALVAREGTTLRPVDYPVVSPLTLTAPGVPALTDVQKNQVLRALQVAMASTSAPIPFERLSSAMCDTTCNATLNPFGTEFERLIERIFPASSVVATNTANLFYKNALRAATPQQIAAVQDAWFLPAPIQRVERPTTDTVAANAAENPRKSGFYDRREKRWITMLQTNIASLSVWNRDGLYVDADNETLAGSSAPYTASTTKRDLAFNNGAGANFTNGLAFGRSPADNTAPLGSFKSLGLASSDQTEGGLVLHTSVRDDLNGDGTIVATDDITIDTTNPIYKKNPDNTDYQDLKLSTPDKRVIIDYYRIYPGDRRRESPFGFAFSGGDYLPNALLLSSDQAVYVQGNFNNSRQAISLNTASEPSIDRLPASIIADTITALSNECTRINPVGMINKLNVPLSQLKCGIPPIIDGDDEVTYDSATSPMTINAAFLANTNISSGNYRVGRTRSTELVYSGGVNNYIRLLEDWNVTSATNNLPLALNYNGSLVSLGEPLEYSGNYRSGGGEGREDLPYYNVPFRNFNYDRNFNKIDGIPPLTPKASYIMQKNFSRVY